MSAMALPIIPNVIRAAVKGVTPAGTPWVNVLHFRKTSGQSFQLAADAINAQLDVLYGAGAGATTGWADTANTAARADTVDYLLLDGLTASYQLALNNPGVDTSNPMPPDSCIAFAHRTGLRGRSYRGRTYWAAYGENVNTNGRLDAATATGQVAAWTSFRTALAALTPTIEFVVASYKLADATAVTSTTVDNQWDRQKRRKA